MTKQICMGFRRRDLNNLMRSKGLFDEWTKMGTSHNNAIMLLKVGHDLPANASRKDKTSVLRNLIEQSNQVKA